MVTCLWLCPGVSQKGGQAEPSLVMWDMFSMPKLAGSAYSDSESGEEGSTRDSSIHDRSCKKREKLKSKETESVKTRLSMTQ